MRITNLFFLLLVCAMLIACDTDKGTSNQDTINTDTTNISNFNPANSMVPFPNDLLFKDTLDGTLNIPVADQADLSDPQVALNALDGFSTVAPMSTSFLGAINAASITPSAVRLFEVTLSSAPGGAVVAINNELTFGIDFRSALSSVDTTDSTLVIVPLKPLKPKSSYYAVITNALMSASGKAVAPSVTYALVKGADPLVDSGSISQIPALSDQEAQDLEPLRQLVNFSEATVAANASPTLTTDEIVLSWSFTTQSIGDVLSAARGLVGSPVTSVSAFGPDLFGMGNGKTPLGAADIMTGTIDLPYYLAASTGGVNDPTALGSFWRGAGDSFLTQFNSTPVATDTVTTPLLITIPTVGSAPWPVVIFQHGITADRSSMLGIADALAGVGYAVIAIDMPMHGIDSSSPFYQAGNERTFDLDLVTQDSDDNIVDTIPDGITDSSGLHFINLTNLLNTRDNLRQSVADLFALTAAIASIDVDGSGADFDASNICFIGHSLGAMLGTVFLALEPDVEDAVLAFGGTSLPKILDGSAAFGPTISAGLAANGVIKGTPEYESFLGAAQAVVDSGDPVNYSLDAPSYAPSAAAGRGLLFFEIVGGNGSPSDLVVPNTVPDGNDSTGTVPAPLAGTEPQLQLLGLTQVNSGQTSASDLRLTTKFIAGDHRSLLDPATDADITTEIQTQAASFIGSNGMVLTVDDPNLLLAP
ncbi:MAG: lipase [Gammaproteobacteria bacterium]|nr:lipase [Gammaproteobacteria bacterium]